MSDHTTNLQRVREELIQVAAVAVAIVTDLDNGTTGGVFLPLDIWRDVRAERVRQEEKWGPQHHPVEAWLAILMEEVGEAAQAALEDVMFR